MSHAPVRVVHLITRMILGGAQENTLHTCAGLLRHPAWQPVLVTGPPIGPEGELLSHVREAGIPCRVLPELRRNLNTWRDAVAFEALVRLLRGLGPTIVHTHSSKAGILGRVAARVAGVPIVVHTIEGLPFHRYAPAWMNAAFIAAERAVAPATDRIACVAQAMVRQALDAGVGRPEQYCVIYSGMDVDAYRDAGRHRARVRSRFGLAEDDIVVAKVARLFPLKGHRFVLQAAARTVRRFPKLKLLFVGDGVLRSGLAHQAVDLGIGDRVVFAGLVPPEEIPEIIGATDAVVHASLREGLARVLVQALLCEKPVVTFDLDGAPEVIVDGETGRLVEAESVDGLSEALAWTLDNPDRARRMAAEGRRRFADRFRIETMVSETDKLYRALLAEKGLPQPPAGP